VKPERRPVERSIFDRETLSDFIDPLVERIEARMDGPVVKVKYISARQKSENPVVRFHVDEDLLDRVTHGNNNVPQDVHRIPLQEKMMLQFRMIGIDGRLPRSLRGV
jgi:hypothetical protein